MTDSRPDVLEFTRFANHTINIAREAALAFRGIAPTIGFAFYNRDELSGLSRKIDDRYHVGLSIGLRDRPSIALFEPGGHGPPFILSVW